MSANRHFQLKSFSSLFAAEMAKALDAIPGVDPRLKTELRAPNGKTLGLADLNGFLFSVNTGPVKEDPVSIVTLEAESYDQKSGSIRIERKGGATNLGYIRTGDWVKYADINFGMTGLDTFEARIATSRIHSYGRIEVYLDEISGQPAGTFTRLSGPGGWSKFQTHAIKLDQTIKGNHDIYLRFKSGYNIDWFQFTSE